MRPNYVWVEIEVLGYQLLKPCLRRMEQSQTPKKPAVSLALLVVVYREHRRHSRELWSLLEAALLRWDEMGHNLDAGEALVRRVSAGEGCGLRD